MAVVAAIAKNVLRPDLHQRDAGTEDDCSEAGQSPLHRAADAVTVAEVVAHDDLRRHGCQIRTAKRRELPLEQATVRATARANLAVVPGLGADPLQGVVTVRSVVAIRVEGAL